MLKLQNYTKLLLDQSNALMRAEMDAATATRAARSEKKEDKHRTAKRFSIARARSVDAHMRASRSNASDVSRGDPEAEYGE